MLGVSWGESTTLCFDGSLILVHYVTNTTKCIKLVEGVAWILQLTVGYYIGAFEMPLVAFFASASPDPSDMKWTSYTRSFFLTSSYHGILWVNTQWCSCAREKTWLSHQIWALCASFVVNLCPVDLQHRYYKTFWLWHRKVVISIETIHWFFDYDFISSALYFHCRQERTSLHESTFCIITYDCTSDDVVIR